MVGEDKQRRTRRGMINAAITFQGHRILRLRYDSYYSKYVMMTGG